MALIPGTRLGVYEITTPLGQGGMGQVYRARDTKLDRDVAIKILPEAFAHDADRLARFTREAKTLAALNHPNIAAIYGLEESAGVTALVMELVEGDDLSQRIKKGAIPIDEALPIAKQIAEALEAAHEQGIIHRDLKPANIKVRPDGTVKVLDFGLAKAMDPPAGSSPNVSQSPTITTPAMTQAGMILGTAAYMAPEQARGKPVDKRADIWAFGAVLFEMLTGTRAFGGDDVAETLANVINKEPAWDALSPAVPTHVRQTLRLCLKKSTRERVPDIGAVRLALGGAFEATEPSTSTYADAIAAPPGVPPGRRRLLSAGLAVGLAAGLSGLAVWIAKRDEPVAVARFVLTATPDASMAAVNTWRQLAIAPDGSVAYGAGEGIYLRRVGEVNPVLVRGAQSGRGPFFSPDGRSLGFFTTSGILSQVSLLGGVGSPILTAEPTETRNPSNERDDLGGASWGPRDVIVLGSVSGGLSRVNAAEGTQAPLTQVGADGESHRWPYVLPDGRGVLFTVWTGDADTARIAVCSLETGKVTELVRGGTSPGYSPTGHLMYAAGGTLRAVRFDAERLTMTGDATPVVENVFVSSSGAAYYGIADVGTLVYFASTEVDGADTLALVDASGQAQALGVPGGRAGYGHPRVSPKGDRVAYTARYTEGDDITLYEIGTDAAPQRLTFGGGHRYPVWSADGRRVMFQSEGEGAGGIFSQAIDGAGPVERLTTPADGERHIPDSASSDGRWLTFTAVRDRASEVWRLAFASREAAPLVVSPGARIAQSAFSPNGQWLAYQSTETGEDEIFVQPFPPNGAKYQLPSLHDNHHPLWAPDGRSLFFVPGPALFARVSVETTPTFRFGNPVSLNLNRTGRTGPPTELRRLDIMPDGQRFVGIWPDALLGESPKVSDRRLILVLNWHEELKRLVP